MIEKSPKVPVSSTVLYRGIRVSKASKNQAVNQIRYATTKASGVLFDWMLVSVDYSIILYGFENSISITNIEIEP
jgi:hypothetical protein